MTTNVVVNAGDDYLGDRALTLPACGIDITGFDLTFMVAERVSGDVVIIKSGDYGDVLPDTYLEGVAVVELFGMDTQGIGNGPLNYQLTGVDYDLREITLLQGRFYVTTGISDGS